ncbi:MAG: hypothetical protein WBM14_00950, partial [Terracidiphilus sp.]
LWVVLRALISKPDFRPPPWEKRSAKLIVPPNIIEVIFADDLRSPLKRYLQYCCNICFILSIFALFKIRNYDASIWQNIYRSAISGGFDNWTSLVSG